VSLYDLGSDEAVEWNPLMTSIVVAIIPVVLLLTLV
jgi:ABC-type glycerol-3-phosphate transport system permease component